MKMLDVLKLSSSFLANNKRQYVVLTILFLLLSLINVAIINFTFNFRNNITWYYEKEVEKYPVEIVYFDLYSVKAEVTKLLSKYGDEYITVYSDDGTSVVISCRDAKNMTPYYNYYKLRKIAKQLDDFDFSESYGYLDRSFEKYVSTIGLFALSSISLIVIMILLSLTNVSFIVSEQSEKLGILRCFGMKATTSITIILLQIIFVSLFSTIIASFSAVLFNTLSKNYGAKVLDVFLNNDGFASIDFTNYIYSYQFYLYIPIIYVIISLLLTIVAMIIKLKKAFAKSPIEMLKKSEENAY